MSSISWIGSVFQTTDWQHEDCARLLNDCLLLLVRVVKSWICAQCSSISFQHICHRGNPLEASVNYTSQSIRLSVSSSSDLKRNRKCKGQTGLDFYMPSRHIASQYHIVRVLTITLMLWTKLEDGPNFPTQHDSHRWSALVLSKYTPNENETSRYSNLICICHTVWMFFRGGSSDLIFINNYIFILHKYGFKLCSC